MSREGACAPPNPSTEMNYIVTAINWVCAALRAADLMPGFGSASAIFCSVAWVATLFAAVMILISFFTGGGDTDVDMADGDSGGFSVRSVVGFLLGFGWGGYMAVQIGMSVWASVITGVVLGVVMFFVVLGIVRFIYSLRSEGSKDYSSKTMVGMTGVVYVTIPPAGESGGQVQISREGSQLITMAAVQEGDTPLPSQTPIEVVSATPHQVTVRRACAAPRS